MVLVVKLVAQRLMQRDDRGFGRVVIGCHKKRCQEHASEYRFKAYSFVPCLQCQPRKLRSPGVMNEIRVNAVQILRGLTI